jgi:hypothetical protein
MSPFLGRGKWKRHKTLLGTLNITLNSVQNYLVLSFKSPEGLITLLSGIFCREVLIGCWPSLCHFPPSPFPTAEQ